MTQAARIDCSAATPRVAELGPLAPADADALAAAQTDASTLQADLDAQAANAATLRDRARLVLGNLENAAAAWPNLTAAQKDQTQLLTTRAVCRLIRLVLQQLDQAP